MTFMIAWSLGRGHFKVTISRFPRKRCWFAGGRSWSDGFSQPPVDGGRNQEVVLCSHFVRGAAFGAGPACPAPAAGHKQLRSSFAIVISSQLKVKLL